jgi:hypothetical protein
MALPILDGNQTAATLSTVLTSGEHIPAHTVVSLGSQAITDVRSAVSGSVVSISNFPSTQTVAGAVTANGGDGTFLVGGLRGGSKTAFPMDVGSGYLQTKVESMPAISGTVSATVTLGVVSQGCFGATIQGYDTLTGVTFSNCVPVKLFEDATGLIGNVAGTVTVGNAQQLADTLIDQTSFYAPLQVSIQGAGADVPVSLPKGALTTRFGSVTTANTAQITSAVTNTSRKYLLAQNISAGTVTIGIGFSPTTTQGIQLTAGAGLTFDSFCPTGAVYWLGAVTGAAFTILEG